MQRREVLKILMSATAFSAMPVELLSAVQQARADAGSPPGLRTLNRHQNATVTALAELIIPETDTPGAKGAKVNEFIDLLLTEWFSQAETSAFLRELASIDEQSHKAFGADFLDAKPAQQADLMKRFDDQATEFARARKAAVRMGPPSPPENFFYTFKRLTLVGYYTSEIGFKKELGKSIIPASHAGCAPLPEHHS